MGPEIRAVGRRLVVCLAVALVAPACALNQEGVQPPRDDIFFPSGAMVDRTGQWLYVANSNSNLRFNNGTLSLVNLDAAGADRAKASTWSDCPELNYIRPSDAPASTPMCCWDVLDRHVLNCESRQYVDKNATVRLGSFAAGMEFNPGCAEEDDTAATPCGGRLFVAVRGNSSITYVDVKVGADNTRQLDCSDGGPGTFAECDENHRIAQRPAPDDATGKPVALPDAAKVILPEEPYALARDVQPDPTAPKDPTKGLARLLVGHLRGGAISLIDINLPTPRLIGYYGAVVPADTNGLRGITSLLRTGPGVFYAGSRYVPRVSGVQTTGGAGTDKPQAESLDNIAVVGNGLQYVSGLPGSEARGIAFVDPIDGDPAPQGALVYTLVRVPPALMKFEAPNQPPVDVLETCNSPTFLYKHGDGINTRLYVNCFEDGEVYVFDPRVPRLVDIIEVGRGPAGLAFPPTGATGYGKLMYVVGFGANNISVVDIDPGSETENHVVQRIGFPSAVPR